MAFTEIKYWNATVEPVLELQCWQRADRVWFNLGWMRRPLGLVSAFALHLFLALIFIRVSESADPLLMSRGSSPGLKLFTFPENSENDEAPLPQKKEVAGGAQSTTRPAPAARASEPVQTEWTISQFRVPHSGETAVAITAPNPGAITPAPASGSAGTSGSSGFDPYAGASPQRPGDVRYNVQPNAPGSSAMAQATDRAPYAVLQAFLTQALKSRYPQLKGNFLLAVQLNAKGNVSEVVVRQGYLDKEALRWLLGRLRTQPALLAHSATPGMLLNLPEIRLL